MSDPPHIGAAGDEAFPQHDPEDPLRAIGQALAGEDPVESYRMPLIDHLRELRKRLLISLAAIFIAIMVCFAYAQPIWDFLAAPMNDALSATGRGTMAITEPLEGFMTYLKVAAIAGVGLASPVVFYEVWRFVAPGLYPKEQKFILPLVIASTTLFLAGAAFGYFVIFRFVFSYLLQITSPDVKAVLSIDAYLGAAVRLLLAFGICFQLPVVVFFLSRAGLIDHRDMTRFFKYSVVAIFLLSAVLTPPDVLSQILMAAPLLLLYGIGIAIARIFSTKVRE